KFFADKKCLSDAFRLRLHGVVNRESKASAIVKQLLDPWSVLRSRDHQDFADPGQHQRAERIINQRFVEDRQQALPYRMRQWIEPGARSASQNDAFVGARFARAFGHLPVVVVDYSEY